MWGKNWVTTVPFECHVHLNISFSSTPCFLNSSNCPLYKINHFGFTSEIYLFFFMINFCSQTWLPAGKSELRGKAMLCSALQSSSKSKWDEWAAVLFGIHVLPEALPSSALSWNPSKTCLWTERLVSEVVNLWCVRGTKVQRNMSPSRWCATSTSACLRFCISGCKWLRRERQTCRDLCMRNCTISVAYARAVHGGSWVSPLSVRS